MKILDAGDIERIFNNFDTFDVDVILRDYKIPCDVIDLLISRCKGHEVESIAFNLCTFSEGSLEAIITTLNAAEYKPIITFCDIGVNVEWWLSFEAAAIKHGIQYYVRYNGTTSTSSLDTSECPTSTSVAQLRHSQHVAAAQQQNDLWPTIQLRITECSNSDGELRLSGLGTLDHFVASTLFTIITTNHDIKVIDLRGTYFALACLVNLRECITNNVCIKQVLFDAVAATSEVLSPYVVAQNEITEIVGDRCKVSKYCRRIMDAKTWEKTLGDGVMSHSPTPVVGAAEHGNAEL